MRLTCGRESLLAACQAVAAAVPSRTTREILLNVKLVADGDGLTVTAFDGELGVTYDLRGVAADRAGATVVPPVQLTRILRESDGEHVMLDATAEVTKVSAGGGRFELPARDPAEYPDLPAFDDGGRYHEATAGVLRALVRRTAFAADKKDSVGRFSIKSVLWEADGRAVRLVATDTRRLATCEGPAAVFGEPHDGKVHHLVPPKAITLLERNLADDGESVRVALRPNDALFRTGRATVYTTLVQGRFPPYRDIVGSARKETTTQITLPVGEFLACVRRAAIVTDEESKRVDMTFSPGKVAMQARGQDTGSCEVEMPLTEYHGAEATIAFDPHYVMEYLRALDGEPTVALEMSGPDKPALFRCGESTYVLMPLVG